MKRGSSADIISGGQYACTREVSSCHHLSRPSVQGTGFPVRLRTSTCSTEGHSFKAASTIAFVAIVFPPRRPSSVVISKRDAQSRTRSRRDSAENPAKTTEWTAPIRAQAKKAAAACHVSRLRRCVSCSGQSVVRAF